MMYTRSMIEHVQQIRKMLPIDMRPHVRLANPDLLDQLSDLYWELQDKLIKEKIEKLMSLAGPAWLDLLHNRQQSSEHTRCTYRGVALPDTPARTAKTASSENAGKRKLMYRGQPVQT